MKIQHFFRYALGLFLVTVALPFSRATTVVAPEFDELVSKADYVVRATVTSVTSSWEYLHNERNIYTRVELKVSEVVAGTPPQSVVLEILGGQVGEQQLEIDGVPSFKVGDDGVFFVQGNGTQFCPLVAVMHGNYRVKRDASNREFVARDDDSPLESELDVSRPMHGAAKANGNSAHALSPADFISKIRASRQAHGVQKNKSLK